jgi:hypothetical protein
MKIQRYTNPAFPLMMGLLLALGACGIQPILSPAAVSTSAITPSPIPTNLPPATVRPPIMPSPTQTPRLDGRDYAFDGSISREVLENYLSRSITMQGLLQGWGNAGDNIRMLINTGAKFAGRVLSVWGNESALPGLLPKAKEYADRIHALDPEMILQAGVFEAITPDVERLTIPDWVFTAFDLEPEGRNFRYESMLFRNGLGRDIWGGGSSLPDISQLETRLWFYYAAKSYIDVGVEAIHFGNMDAMDEYDPRHEYYLDLLSRVRAYAAKNARRHMVLCDGYDSPHGGIVLPSGRLLLDFHSSPARIDEVTDKPEEGVLRFGYNDSIYGRSQGGITPSGWSCESLPYMVDIDNYDTSGNEGRNVGGFYVWGYDEIGWFAHQSEQYRNDWLRYAWHWIKDNDKNGHLEMPGIRVLGTPGKLYWANTRSPATPDGYNQEETIKQIWIEDNSK